MELFQIKMELLSESIFGCGENSGFIDNEILKDELGLPYLNGKTFKGNLREEMKSLAQFLDGGEGEYTKIFEKLMGVEFDFNFETLKFSDCIISPNLREIIKEAISNKELNSEEVLESLTEVRSFTRIENGVAQDGSLRSSRVIKKGLILYCNLESIKELNKKELGILACSLRSLQSIGMMRSRGKGEVKCSLYKNGKDITEEAILSFRKEIS
ncbi:RAMP superfamily CRISPR-associated protein [Clostridium perfringens]|uniref:RAMP superfamily CRISPR-associated protein n=1 Tax=Clostridium perfringens TaxID=1502 RepID=UPI001F586821|nr:RAMP superfamily CRISPR-associated protein [Clostridium perfringens]MCI2779026.1 RAMP superfamily CRISPR-associated protein [Clostridium perfringens]